MGPSLASELRLRLKWSSDDNNFVISDTASSKRLGGSRGGGGDSESHTAPPPASNLPPMRVSLTSRRGTNSDQSEYLVVCCQPSVLGSPVRLFVVVVVSTFRHGLVMGSSSDDERGRRNFQRLVSFRRCIMEYARGGGTNFW